MDLLLKREEKPGGLGRRYDLFAKLELQPEEMTLLRKASPQKVIVLEDDPAKAQTRWRLCLIPGALLACIVAAVLLSVLFGLPYVMATAPVAAILWIPCTKLIFNQFRPYVSVADLITGRTIHCKSLDELLVKEEDIREKSRRYVSNLSAYHSLGDVQQIKFNPE
jgi:hypothetical protein